MVVGQGSFVEFDNFKRRRATHGPGFGDVESDQPDQHHHHGFFGGALAAGIIEMEIKLVEEFPVPGVVVPGVFLHITCNIPAAGLFNGTEEEGFELTIPDSPSGTFKPPVIVGGTVFSILNEKRGG